MNCNSYRSPLAAAARGGKLDRRVQSHLNSCEACGEFLAGQRCLAAASAELAAQGRAVSLPPALESELLAEFDAVRRPAPQPRYFWLTAGAFATAAVLMGVILLLKSPGRPVTPQPQLSVSAPPLQTPAEPDQPLGGFRPVTVPPRPIRPPQVRTARPAEHEEEAFVSIPYTMPLAPEERADVVRMDVPVAALIAAGLPMRVRDMGGSVSADVLVGEDGRARAVRLISDSNFNRSYK